MCMQRWRAKEVEAIGGRVTGERLLKNFLGGVACTAVPFVCGEEDRPGEWGALKIEYWEGGMGNWGGGLQQSQSARDQDLKDLRWRKVLRKNVCGCWRHLRVLLLLCSPGMSCRPRSKVRSERKRERERERRGERDRREWERRETPSLSVSLGAVSTVRILCTQV